MMASTPLTMMVRIDGMDRSLGLFPHHDHP
jgi:hypothetical protein